MYMSLDEAVGIHEMLNGAIRKMFASGGMFFFASVIPGMILALTVLISPTTKLMINQILILVM